MNKGQTRPGWRLSGWECLPWEQAGLSSKSKHLYNEQAWLFIYPYYRTVSESLLASQMRWNGLVLTEWETLLKLEEDMVCPTLVSICIPRYPTCMEQHSESNLRENLISTLNLIMYWSGQILLTKLQTLERNKAWRIKRKKIETFPEELQTLELQKKELNFKI